jgi:hypothetical protein
VVRLRVERRKIKEKSSEVHEEVGEAAEDNKEMRYIHSPYVNCAGRRIHRSLVDWGRIKVEEC